MRLSEFTRSSHTQLPRRRVHDYALPLARRANRQSQPGSTMLRRSFPHACALNYPLPLARLPTSANCPCALLQSGSLRAGLPYNYQLPLAQLPSPTETPVRLRGLGCRARVSWGLVGAVPEPTLYYFLPNTSHTTGPQRQRPHRRMETLEAEPPPYDPGRHASGLNGSPPAFAAWPWP